MSGKKPLLISLAEAAAQGFDRVRKPIWADPIDHIKIDVLDGKVGPWLHLYCPFNKECNGRDPVDHLWFQYGKDALQSKEFVSYLGPLPGSDQYKAAVAQYEGCQP